MISPAISQFSRLAALMRLAGMTHSRAAARVGVQRPALSLILAGKRRPSPLVDTRLQDLERALASEAAAIVGIEAAQ